MPKPPTKTPTPMNAVLIASVAFFAIACCLPALDFRKSDGSHDVMFGLRALAVGWSGLFAGVMAWYANPVWLLGVNLAYVRKPIPAVLLGLIAMGIATATFSVVGRELPADEGNVVKMTVVELLPGCLRLDGQSCPAARRGPLVEVPLKPKNRCGRAAGW